MKSNMKSNMKYKRRFSTKRTRETNKILQSLIKKQKELWDFSEEYDPELRDAFNEYNYDNRHFIKTIGKITSAKHMLNSSHRNQEIDKKKINLHK